MSSVSPVDLKRIIGPAAADSLYKFLPSTEFAILAAVNEFDLSQVRIPEERNEVMGVAYHKPLGGQKKELRKAVVARFRPGKVNDGQGRLDCTQAAGEDLFDVWGEVRCNEAAGRAAK